MLLFTINCNQQYAYTENTTAVPFLRGSWYFNRIPDISIEFLDTRTKVWFYILSNIFCKMPTHFSTRTVHVEPIRTIALLRRAIDLRAVHKSKLRAVRIGLRDYEIMNLFYFMSVDRWKSTRWGRLRAVSAVRPGSGSIKKFKYYYSLLFVIVSCFASETRSFRRDPSEPRERGYDVGKKTHKRIRLKVIIIVIVWLPLSATAPPPELALLRPYRVRKRFAKSVFGIRSSRNPTCIKSFFNR